MLDSLLKNGLAALLLPIIGGPLFVLAIMISMHKNPLGQLALALILFSLLVSHFWYGLIFGAVWFIAAKWLGD
jgi:hypothetical protein